MRGNFKLYGNYSHFVPGIAEGLILLLWLIVGAGLGSAVTIIFRRFLGEAATVEYGTLVSYPVMFIPPMLYASWKSRKNRWKNGGENSAVALDEGKFTPSGGFVCALVAVLATLAGGIAIDAVSSLLPPMPDWLEKLLKSMTSGNLWANFLCISIFAPFFEEWLCRGMILRGLLGNGHKPWLAIVLSALFFALIHANPWQAVPAFAIGLIFGYVYYRTGSLKLTMLMHCTNNTLALVVSHVDSLKDYDNWMELMGAGLYWTCFAASALILILAARFFHKTGR